MTVYGDFNAIVNSGARYQIITMDPPWTYDSKRTGGSMRSGAEQLYQTLTMCDLKALPMQLIAAKDSYLMLWATTPLLPEAFELMQAYGFRYKTSLYWNKVREDGTGRLGMGHYFRGQVEQCLVGVRGNVKPFKCQERNIFNEAARSHSTKPEKYWEMLNRIVEKHNLTPAIELFSRQERKGWDAFGNDVTLEARAPQSSHSILDIEGNKATGSTL